MDLATVLGLLIALLGIIGGQIIEGGQVASLVQGTAALIVFGGTAGAVFVSTRREDLRMGLKLFRMGLIDDEATHRELVVKEMIAASKLARTESIIGLERRLGQFTDPFMQKVLRFVIDGIEADTLRMIFETEMDVEEENLLAGAKIWSDAGGYAPTIGIIGAVLGLIHVMENLTDTSKLGAGIAVAFVATIYGVGSANLFFLPFSVKLRRKIRRRMETKQMILEASLGIMSGQNPFIIRQKLSAYLRHDTFGTDFNDDVDDGLSGGPGALKGKGSGSASGGASGLT